MLISFQAFSWSPKSSELTLDSYADALCKVSKPIVYRNRRIHFHENDGLLNGLVVTVKDMKTFCTLWDDGAQIRLTPHQLNMFEKVADFNFFVFDKKNGRGLFQYYHHSCSLLTFNIIARTLYRARLDRLKQGFIDKNDGKKDDQKFLREVGKKFAGYLDTSVIEKKGSFSERIKTMKDVNRLEFEFESLEFEQSAYAPVAAYIKKSRHSVSLSAEVSKLEKVSGAARLFSENPMKSARVEGLDKDGNDVVYKMYHDFDRFGQYEYDDLVPALNLDSSNAVASINGNRIIERLRQTYLKSALAQAIKL